VARINLSKGRDQIYCFYDKTSQPGQAYRLVFITVRKTPANIVPEINIEVAKSHRDLSFPLLTSAYQLGYMRQCGRLISHIWKADQYV
jgi:hypothetical protein